MLDSSTTSVFGVNGLWSGGHESQHLRSCLGDGSTSFQVVPSGRVTYPNSVALVNGGKRAPHRIERESAGSSLRAEFDLTFYYENVQHLRQELSRAHSQLKNHRAGHSRFCSPLGRLKKSEASL